MAEKIRYTIIYSWTHEVFGNRKTTAQGAATAEATRQMIEGIRRDMYGYKPRDFKIYAQRGTEPRVLIHQEG